MESVAAMIEQGLALTQQDNELSGWSERVRAFVNGMTPIASGELVSFSCQPLFESDEPAKAWQLVPNSQACPVGLRGIAQSAWRRSRGVLHPSGVRESLAAARIEYAKAELYFVLYLAGTSWDTGWTGEDLDIAAVSSAAKVRDWLDADSVARSPLPPSSLGWWSSTHVMLEWWSNQHAPDYYDDVLGAFRERLLYSLALTWIDQALVDATQMAARLCDVSEAMEWVGELRAWRECNAELRTDQREKQLGHSKAMTDKRHAENRAVRARAVEMYRQGHYPSKDAAAEIIGPQVNRAFRVVRQWFNGIQPASESVRR